MSEQEKKEYWKPSVTADVLLVTIQPAEYRDDGAYVNFLLIKRSEKSEAFPNYWALPGGFLNKGESLEECAIRELFEETGVEANMLLPIGTFSRHNRDPRGQTISEAFMSVFPTTKEQPLNPKSGDDAKEIGLFLVKGNFRREDGSLDVSLRCAATGEKIAFHAKFSRGNWGLINTSIDYKEGDGYSKLAFDHAEIIARAILKAPDLIMPTKTQPIDNDSKKTEQTENQSK